MRLQIYGLPETVQVESRTLSNGSDQGNAIINLAESFAEHRGPAGERYLQFELPIKEASWAAGRVYNWKLPSGGAMADTADRSLEVDSAVRNSYWAIRPGVAMSGPDRRETDTELRFSTAGNWNIRAVITNSSSQILGDYHFPEFDATETAWLSATSPEADFGLGVRMVDRMDAETTVGDSTWLREVLPGDLRRQQYDASFFVPMIDLETASYHYDFARTYSSVEKRQVFNRGLESPAWSTFQPHYNYDIALFELPRDAPVSIGSLQHLAFQDGPIYNLGNSWSEHNGWFDRYFLSAREDSGAALAVARNQSLHRIESATVTPNTASGWWIEGAFNLNSVSVDAWAAVLRGLGGGGVDYAFDFLTHNPRGEVIGVSRETIDRPVVARFAQSAGVLWEATPVDFDGIYQAGLRTYRRGIRSLTAAQVEGLAAQITKHVAAHAASAGPYRSVRAFLAADPAWNGDNLLEDSIKQYDESVDPAKRINWDHFFPDDPLPIDRAAPAYLTSGDLMTALAPFVTTRSDTFKVRLYGETVSPMTAAKFSGAEPHARAWLEAIVQRFPDGVSQSDFKAAGSDEWTQLIAEPNWGRRFRVLSLRWLKEEEL